MSYETIIYRQEGRVGVITLNRPQRLNAISKQLALEVAQALDDIEKDEKLRVAVITGGPRPDGRPCFCAGADISAQAKEPRETMFEDYGIIEGIEEMIKPHEAVVRSSSEKVDLPVLLEKIRWLTKPVIASIDGICSAGGLEMALTCDMRVVAETAQLSDLHMKNLNRVGGGGITALLALTVGMAKAKELAITGDAVDGNEAVRIGLANRVFPPDKFWEGTMALANKIAERHPAAVRMCKVAVDYAFYPLMESALRYNHLCRAALKPIVQSDQVAKDFVAKVKPKV